MKIPHDLKVMHKRMRRALGWVRGGGHRIHIDLRRQHNPLHTLLHEVLHVRYPEWSEAHVRRETARRWRRLKDRDLVRLARLLGTIR